MLHIHCGDAAADVARLAALPGDLLAWRDSPATGPCALDPAEHRRLRAAWWAIDPAELQDPHALPRDRELVLWFGPDPWEQLAQVELLAALARAPGPVSLVPLERGVGEMAPSALAARLARRWPAPRPCDAPVRLWIDLCGDDRDALAAAVHELRGDPQLPHLAAALARVLADRRDDLTARRVRALVAGGARDVATLMRRLRALEAPTHGAWYGDAIVARLLAASRS